MNFFNSTELEYIHKSYSVFIQTDKAIYKPGHKVQFRAVVLNSHLKPSVTGALDIHITVSELYIVQGYLQLTIPSVMIYNYE